MGKKILINTLYTVGLFICIITLVWGVQHSRYEMVAGAVLIGALFVYLKIKLLKEVRSTINKNNAKS
ncbi:DUF6358 family protein [Mucilaginibacter ginkgonis]|uniref:Uncharacterized protein n=1 Tax=Mucilaginibacter ginkgonis TaxID=2682091 RepID=A0A6I4I349_9SPHI|nr:DUF6358 family protein [Mucilaginibacter ginkgonis]QQL49070.1 hypothetical protein GO620_012910 [Mucilaginibacter ginkgonis]